MVYSSNIYNFETIKKIIEQKNPKIIFHLSDEKGDRQNYHEIFKNTPLVYRQYRYNNYNNYENIKFLPLGYHCWDKNYIKKSVKSVNKRNFIWCFMGSIKNNREKDLKLLQQYIKPYFNEKQRLGRIQKFLIILFLQYVL